VATLWSLSQRQHSTSRLQSCTAPLVKVHYLIRKTEMQIVSFSCVRADDLDTRLLRAMVIKGILEQITTSTVNLVNADLLAKNRGLRIRETFVSAEGKVDLSYLSLKHI